MLHFEVELEVAYELCSRLHYRLPDLKKYVNVICNLQTAVINSMMKFCLPSTKSAMSR